MAKQNGLNPAFDEDRKRLQAARDKIAAEKQAEADRTGAYNASFGSLLDEAQAGVIEPEEELGKGVKFGGSVPPPKPAAPPVPKPEAKPEGGGGLGLLGAALGPVGSAIGLGMAAYGIASQFKSADDTTGSISGQLIAGGGGRTSDNAMPNAIVSALSRLSGLRSRM